LSFAEALTVNQEREIRGDQNYQPEERFAFDYTFLSAYVFLLIFLQGVLQVRLHLQPELSPSNF